MIRRVAAVALTVAVLATAGLLLLARRREIPPLGGPPQARFSDADNPSRGSREGIASARCPDAEPIRNSA